MLTASKEFRKSNGTCPMCFGEVKLFARLDGLFHWSLVEQCSCMYISESVTWPFDQAATFDAVKPADFYPVGILIHTGNAVLRRDIADMYEELYAEEEAQYMDEVDHGWEQSHF